MQQCEVKKICENLRCNLRKSAGKIFGPPHRSSDKCRYPDSLKGLFITLRILILWGSLLRGYCLKISAQISYIRQICVP